ncbi:hypothetical protein VCRA2119O51_260032 [Vibrio crassostreae]|nr:hypothetical protein VCRA2119O51_260032 [Vibrio crassostreae]CAK2364655.1 hypothetical protein VCRA2119O386_400033 [Vibrio crassostreae]CAK3554518.1 hypothetical protein VCRA2120O388_400032 [Vibrio crassostreae]
MKSDVFYQWEYKCSLGSTFSSTLVFQIPRVQFHLLAARLSLYGLSPSLEARAKEGGKWGRVSQIKYIFLKELIFLIEIF